MAVCDCCGCEIVDDYGTSLVTGEGTRDDPFVVSMVDDTWLRPAVRIRRTTNQSIPTGAAFTAVSFDSEVFDQGTGSNMWVVGSPTLITIPENGIYVFGGCGQWPVSPGFTRELGIRLNGTTILQLNDIIDDPFGGDIQYQHVTYQERLVAGNTLELVARQETAGAMNLVAQADVTTVFWCFYAGRYV